MHRLVRLRTTLTSKHPSQNKHTHPVPRLMATRELNPGPLLHPQTTSGAGTYALDAGATECSPCNSNDQVDPATGELTGGTGACMGQGWCSTTVGICECTNGDGGAQTGYSVSHCW